jgi:hypothetical protein
LLRKTLRDVQRKLIFRAEVATVKSFRRLVSRSFTVASWSAVLHLIPARLLICAYPQLTIGCRMLHYTGIGKPSCLIFEKEKPVGETNVVVGHPASSGIAASCTASSIRHPPIRSGC